MRIFYAAQISNFTIKNGKQRFVLSTDACMNLCVGIISSMIDHKKNYKFLVAVPSIKLAMDYKNYYDLFEKKYHKNIKFIEFPSPIGPINTRYHFDFLWWKKNGQYFNDIDVMINDQNTLTKNWNALFHDLKLNIPIASTNYFLDSPISKKVPEKITYFERMMESLNNSNVTAFQCSASMTEALDAYYSFYRRDAGLRGKSTVWNTGVWRKEVTKFSNEKKFKIPTVYFGNRISDSANRYNNYHKFAEAIGIMSKKYNMSKYPYCAIMLNPTKKVTEEQLKFIDRLSNGNAIVHPNNLKWSRVDYLKFINKSHISCNLFTNEVHGGVTHAEAMIAGNILVAPKINNYAYKFERIPHFKYPFLCKVDKKKKELDVNSLANKIYLAIRAVHENKYEEYSFACKKLAYLYESYERASVKIIRDLNELNRSKK